MPLIKNSSLERYIVVRLAILFIAIAALFSLACWLYGVAIHWIAIVLLSMSILSIHFILTFKYQIMRVLTRATLHLDAISKAEYDQFDKSIFTQGKVQLFHQQLQKLSKQLQNHKPLSDHQATLIGELVLALDTPIIVLDSKLRLTYGNKDFPRLFEKNWQQLKHVHPEVLGLEHDDGKWAFIKSTMNQRWQIQHGAIQTKEGEYQMLVFVDAEHLLKENQVVSWQQLIRVMGTEINNCITPIHSISESLLATSADKQQQKLLLSVLNQVQTLANTIDRYSIISNKTAKDCQWLLVRPLIDNIALRYNKLEVALNSDVEKICANAQLFEHFIETVMTHALATNSNLLSIELVPHEHYFIIEFITDGDGTDNPNNTLIPSYSALENEQSLTLEFCQNIVEQLQGVMEIHNNEEVGITLMAIIPAPLEAS